MKKEAIISGLKEAGRVVVLAVVPVLIDSLQKGIVDWRVIGITGAIAFLRFVDKALHEMEPKGVSGGLVRF